MHLIILAINTTSHPIIEYFNGETQLMPSWFSKNICHVIKSKPGSHKQKEIKQIINITSKKIEEQTFV